MADAKVRNLSAEQILEIAREDNNPALISFETVRESLPPLSSPHESTEEFAAATNGGTASVATPDGFQYQNVAGADGRPTPLRYVKITPSGYIEDDRGFLSIPSEQAKAIIENPDNPGILYHELRAENQHPGIAGFNRADTSVSLLYHSLRKQFRGRTVTGHELLEPNRLTGKTELENILMQTGEPETVTAAFASFDASRLSDDILDRTFDFSKPEDGAAFINAALSALHGTDLHFTLAQITGARRLHEAHGSFKYGDMNQELRDHKQKINDAEYEGLTGWGRVPGGNLPSGDDEIEVNTDIPASWQRYESNERGARFEEALERADISYALSHHVNDIIFRLYQTAVKSPGLLGEDSSQTLIDYFENISPGKDRPDDLDKGREYQAAYETPSRFVPAKQQIMPEMDLEDYFTFQKEVLLREALRALETTDISEHPELQALAPEIREALRINAEIIPFRLMSDPENKRILVNYLAQNTGYRPENTNIATLKLTDPAFVSALHSIQYEGDPADFNAKTGMNYDTVVHQHIRHMRYVLSNADFEKFQQDLSRREQTLLHDWITDTTGVDAGEEMDLEFLAALHDAVIVVQKELNKSLPGQDKIPEDGMLFYQTEPDPETGMGGVASPTLEAIRHLGARGAAGKLGKIAARMPETTKLQLAAGLKPMADFGSQWVVDNPDGLQEAYTVLGLKTSINNALGENVISTAPGDAQNPTEPGFLNTLSEQVNDGVNYLFSIDGNGYIAPHIEAARYWPTDIPGVFITRIEQKLEELENAHQERMNELDEELKKAQDRENEKIIDEVRGKQKQENTQYQQEIAPWKQARTTLQQFQNNINEKAQTMNQAMNALETRNDPALVAQYNQAYAEQLKTAEETLTYAEEQGFAGSVQVPFGLQMIELSEAEILRQSMYLPNTLSMYDFSGAPSQERYMMAQVVAYGLANPERYAERLRELGCPPGQVEGYFNMAKGYTQIVSSYDSLVQTPELAQEISTALAGRTGGIRASQQRTPEKTAAEKLAEEAAQTKAELERQAQDLGIPKNKITQALFIERTLFPDLPMLEVRKKAALIVHALDPDFDPNDESAENLNAMSKEFKSTYGKLEPKKQSPAPKTEPEPRSPGAGAAP